MFFSYPTRRLKAVCEDCGRTPHAPRRRCPQCDKLVCVSNCWNKKVGYCNPCSSTFLPEKNGQQAVADKKLTVESKKPVSKYATKNGSCLFCRASFKFTADAERSHQSKKLYCEACFRKFFGWY